MMLDSRVTEVPTWRVNQTTRRRISLHWIDARGRLETEPLKGLLDPAEPELKEIVLSDSYPSATPPSLVAVMDNWLQFALDQSKGVSPKA